MSDNAVIDELLKQKAVTVSPERSEECEMVDHGDYQPHHEFKRLACKVCGGMHCEQPMETMTRMRYCPWCGARVTGWRKLDE